MHTWGPTWRIIPIRSSGEVTSTETHRLVFLERIIEMRRFAMGFCVFDVRDSYEVIFTADRVSGNDFTTSR